MNSNKMSQYMILTTILFLTMFSVFIQASTIAPPEKQQKQQHYQTTEIGIDAAAATTTTTATESSSSSIVVEGVEIPGTRWVDGVRLVRNGHGVRSLHFLGLPIKIYVANLFSNQPIATEHDAQRLLQIDDDDDNKIQGEEEKVTTTSTSLLEKTIHNNSTTASSSSPSSLVSMLQFDFTFLRSVGQSRVTAAWTQQLEASVSYKYPGYERDRDAFIGMFGPIPHKGTETVRLIRRGGNTAAATTVVMDQGVIKGRIEGSQFQKAFLSMWFGEKAVAADLKEGLLSEGGGANK